MFGEMKKNCTYSSFDAYWAAVDTARKERLFAAAVPIVLTHSFPAICGFVGRPEAFDASSNAYWTLDNLMRESRVRILPDGVRGWSMIHYLTRFESVCSVCHQSPADASDLVPVSYPLTDAYSVCYVAMCWDCVRASYDVEPCGGCGELTMHAFIHSDDGGPLDAYCNACWHDVVECAGNWCSETTDPVTAADEWHDWEFYDGPVCDDCWNTAVSCSACSNTTDPETADEEWSIDDGGDGMWLCDDCAYMCWGCDGPFSRGFLSFDSNDDGMCRDCLSSGNYGNCESCETWFCLEDACGDSCSTCWKSELDAVSALLLEDAIPDDWDSDARLDMASGGGADVRSYNFAPTPHFFGKNVSGRFLGVELEVSTSECDTDRAASTAMDELTAAGKRSTPLGFLKSDCSIGDGFELVTHPITWKSLSKRFPRSLLERFAASGVRSFATPDSRQCGLHVHVSRAALPPAALFFALYLTETNVSFFETMAGRSVNNWAGRYGSEPRFLWKLASGQVMAGSRYMMVNLQTGSKPTIEFRLGRGSLDPVRFFGWVGLVDVFARYCEDLAGRMYPDGVAGDDIYLPHLAGFLAFLSDKSDEYPDTVALMSRVLPGGLAGQLVAAEAREAVSLSA